MSAVGLLLVLIIIPTEKIAEDSIQELNDLIGELDLFQKEHELSTLLAKCQSSIAPNKTAQLSINGQPMVFPTPTQQPSPDSVHSTDEIDAASTLRVKTPATPYEGQSIGSASAENGSFNGSFDDDVAANNGYENPSFRYMHQNGTKGLGNDSISGSQEIVLIQDDELSGDTQKYLQENSEIVTMRCKDTQRQSMEKNYASIGLGGIGNDNLIKGRASNGSVAGADAKGHSNNNHQQRLSSFKVDAGQQSPQRSSLNGSSLSGISTLKRNPPQNYPCDKAVAGPVIVDQGQQQQQAPADLYRNGEVAAIDPSANVQMVVQVSPDGKLRSKPTVSPRPTSLSGSFYFYLFF